MDAFRCSAKCCEDRNSSQEVVQRCLASCMQPVMDAESKLQGEVQHLQVHIGKINMGTADNKYYYSTRID